MTSSLTEAHMEDPCGPRTKILEYGDSVIDGFRALTEKYAREDCECPYVRPDMPITYQEHRLSDEQVEMKKALLDSLHSSLLPRLRQQISTMSLSLEPSNLKEDPTFHLQRILALQPEVDKTWDQIQSATLSVSKVLMKFGNDQYLKELKSFRLFNLRTHFIKNLSGFLSALFSESVDSIRLLNLSNQKIPRWCRYMCSAWKSEYGHSVLKAIDSTLAWIKASEYEMVQLNWPSHVSVMDANLKKLLNLIDSIQTHSLNKQSRLTPARQSLMVPIKLAESILPIIKLTRLLLLKKLSRSGISNNKKTPSPFMELCSGQLQSVNQLSQSLDWDCEELLRALKRCNDTVIGDPDAGSDSEEEEMIVNAHNCRSTLCLRIAELANFLPLRVKMPLTIVSRCFLPPHPPPLLNNNIEGFQSSQLDHPIAPWINTWSDQFGLAARRLQVVNRLFAPRFVLDNSLLDLN
ncbi:hypothetical protein PGT21_030978 [Puccinia graminis f. sp. tritici]|uniref:Uncharacterized protein n=1 Tax=Puccinia graminis f. sp. tritici TaxID=56615 RepID=A0A5B0QKB5_PUCGR|nr:hypothetical protein PGT21_030978 [Puccinia graminis f. sp. tritici]